MNSRKLPNIFCAGHSRPWHSQSWLCSLQSRQSSSRTHLSFLLLAALLLAPTSRQNAFAAAAPLHQQAAAPAPGQTRAVGTVKAITDTTVTITIDSGDELKIQLQPDTKILRVAPGQQDIKQATPISASDLQPGDRILVRGKPGDAAKTVLAASIIAMAKTDVAAKQAKDREEWQRHGLGGIVTAVDPAAPTITIGVTVMGQKKSIVVQIAKSTVLRRYAPDSVKFDDAKPAPLDQVHVGDQLRARGTKNSDGSELAADEVVSGTFRNISGTIFALDVSAGTMVVHDLATKKSFTVKVTSDSQLRKLTAPVAQRIAARMKGDNSAATPASAPGGANAAASGGGPGQQGARSGAGGPGGGGTGGGQGGDLQQMLTRMPASNLSDLQKGDAVMIVTTEGTEAGTVTAITLLAGVEPILEASPNGGQSSLLSAWSLGSAPGGDSGTP
jgi:Domain of unknown function (DUF5666)